MSYDTLMVYPQKIFSHLIVSREELFFVGNGNYTPLNKYCSSIFKNHVNTALYFLQSVSNSTIAIIDLQLILWTTFNDID